MSELLQAQLLQDININPVQPSLSVTNLNIFAGGGPARPGFNEFTPLFDRNRAQLNVSGVVGSEWTRGNEAVVSGIYDNVSVSAGQFHYQSDGFRANNDLNYDVYNIFAQAALTPKLNVQAEVRRASSDFANLRLNFDPDRSGSNVEQEVDQNTARIGVRFSPSPKSDFIGSAIYNDVRYKLNENISFGPFFLDLDFDAASNQTAQAMYEALYLYSGSFLNLQSGFSVFDVQNELKFRLTDSSESDTFSTNQRSFFSYTNLNLPMNVTLTFGLSFDDFDEKNLHLQKINPKLGLQWNITPSLRLRLSAFRTVKPPLVTNRTIQPTQVAGFNQFFDDFAGTEAWQYGAGLDARLTDEVSAGVEASRRDLNVPIDLGDRIERDSANESLYRAYLYWAPHPEWSVTGELRFDMYESKGDFLPKKMETWSAPISVHYFHPLGFFAGAISTPVRQHLQGLTGLPDGKDTFFLVDAAVGYRLPKRFGLASLEVRNLFNSGFKYQDDSFRQSREAPTISRFIPERTILGYLTLSF